MSHEKEYAMYKKASDYMPVQDVETIVKHAWCPDADTASAIVDTHHQKIKKQGEKDVLVDRIHCINGDYGNPPRSIEVFSGKNVLFLDFSYRLPIMLEIIKVAKKVMVLDHHRTSRKELVPIKTGCFMSRHHSAAAMAYYYVHGPGEVLPKFVRLIQSYDLGRFEEDPDTMVMTIFINRFIQKSFGNIRMLIEQPELLDAMVPAADVVAARTFDKIAKIMRDKLVVTHLPGERMACFVNGTKLMDLVAYFLLKQRPDLSFVAFVSFRTDPDRCSIKLRSGSGFMDVGTISELFGGGGHASASGFEFGNWIKDQSEETRKLYDESTDKMASVTGILNSAISQQVSSGLIGVVEPEEDVDELEEGEVVVVDV